VKNREGEHIARKKRGAGDVVSAPTARSLLYGLGRVRYDWLLFLHVASAFALISAVVLASVLLVVVRNRDVPSEVARLFRLTRLGDMLGGVGSVGALVFGIWLAIDVTGYELWDGWIIAALVLWVVMGAFGSRTGKSSTASAIGPEPSRPRAETRPTRSSARSCATLAGSGSRRPRRPRSSFCSST
jgi:hypothetical protein